MTRDERRRRGAGWRTRLGQPDDDPGLSAPGYRDLVDEMVYDGVWGRDGLAPADRMVCSLAVLALVPAEQALRRAIGAAIDLGIEPPSILEIFVQIGLYRGFPATEGAVACAGEVFAERGLEVPGAPPSTESLDEVDRRSRDLMAALHGERRQGGYASPDNPVTGALYASASRYGYGEIWSRPGLDLRQRMLCAIAAFVVLGLDNQLRKFGESAKNAGLTRDEVIEAVVQSAPYGGYPQALNALTILSEVP